MAVVVFATEKLRVDLVALMVLLTLTLTGLVSPEEAFAGFANPAVSTVARLLIGELMILCASIAEERNAVLVS